jgi:glycosyltransferase involved in cell wall biosynthesis
MRLTMVVPRYLPHLGGIENHVWAIGSRLQRLGVAVTIATQLEGDRSLPTTEVTADGLVVRRFPSVGKVRGQGVSPALWRWVRDGAGDADLVHAQNYHALTTLPVLTAATVPLVFTPHYLGVGEGRFEGALHAWYARAARRGLRRVHRVICVTRSEASSFAQDVGCADRCIVIPNGVDVQAIREAVPLAGPGRLLLVAGRMEEYKQPHIALEALARLDRTYRLAFVGGGPMVERLRRRAADLGLQDRVLFPGRVQRRELYSWYRSAETVISLSRRECYGLTVAEALAAGCAVVASDIGPHRDVVRNAEHSRVVLVPAKADPDAVATGVLAAQAAEADREPSTMPTWEHVAAQTLEVYGEVLGSS